MKKAILMTGATGLVGSRFTDMFRDKYEVFNMDLTTNVDITDPATISEFVDGHPADTLIHLAAFTNTNEAFKQAGDKNGICYRVNVDGTRNIVDICRTHKIHLIHISTDFVFDGQKKTPYTEADMSSPIEWYGETKAMAEKVVAQGGDDNSIVRISYPYRAQYELKPDLVAKIVTGLQTGTLYPQFTDTLITPTFIDDIARVFDILAERKLKGVYHATGSGSLSPYELACKVASAYGFDPAMVKKGSLTEYLKTNPRPFARFAAMDNTKTQNELGIKMSTIDEGLAEIRRQQSVK